MPELYVFPEIVDKKIRITVEKGSHAAIANILTVLATFFNIYDILQYKQNFCF